MFEFIKSLFDFRERKKQSLQIVLISFLLTFFIARLWSLLIGNSIYIRGFQIHHFYFGTLTLAIGGLTALLSESKKSVRTASALIGMGIGLFADEIGLLLNCTTLNRQCGYAFPDTYDIITVIGLMILLILVVVGFSEKLALKKNGKNSNGSVKELLP